MTALRSVRAAPGPDTAAACQLHAVHRVRSGVSPRLQCRATADHSTTYHLPLTIYPLPPTPYHLPLTTYHLPPTPYHLLPYHPNHLSGPPLQTTSPDHLSGPPLRTTSPDHVLASYSHLPKTRRTIYDLFQIKTCFNARTILIFFDVKIVRDDSGLDHTDSDFGPIFCKKKKCVFFFCS